MLKIFVIVLYAIVVTVAKNRLVITHFKNDKEVPIGSLRVNASIGDNATFHCKIHGNLTNQPLKWIKTPSDNFKSASNDSSKLVLFPVQLKDQAKYSCITKSEKLRKSIDLFINSEKHWKDRNLPIDSDFLQHAFDLPDRPLHFTNYDHFKDSDLKPFKEFKPIEIPEVGGILEYKPIDFSNLNLETSKEGHIQTYTYSHFKQSIYIVPITILIVLGFVRLCYYLRNQTNVPWQQLNSPECTHQICIHRRRVNPSASCILQRANSRLSVLIIQRVTGTSEEGANNNNNQVEESDAPPAYNDVNSNDLPPTYNEAVESMHNSSNVTNNTNNPV